MIKKRNVTDEAVEKEDAVVAEEQMMILLSEMEWEMV
jgi:hypothetical protein